MQIYKDWLHKNNVPYEEESFGLAFQYQGGHFIINDNSNDSNFFRLLMPEIMDAHDNRTKALEATNTITQKFKCAKCFITKHDSVWLATEILLDQTPEIDSIMFRLFQILFDARRYFCEEME